MKYKYLKNEFVNKLSTYQFETPEQAKLQGLKKFMLSTETKHIPLETPFLINKKQITKKQDERQENEKLNEELIENSYSSVDEYSSTDDVYYDDIEMNVNLSIKSKLIIDNCELTICRGKKYGLVGRNGIGKTTLLKNIKKRKFGIPKGIKIYMIEQEFNTDITVIQHVGDDGGKILTGFGFNKNQFNMKLQELSGGWRMRAHLAKAININPDLLLLDEPTNYLDINALCWLEKQIKEMKTVIIVSHDRTFLNNVVDEILHLNDFKIVVYKGNYDSFTKQRQNLLMYQKKEYENQLRQREHLQSFIDRFRASASRASLAQSKIKQLAKMPPLNPPKIDPVIKFMFDYTPCKGTLVEMRDVKFRYESIVDESENICKKSFDENINKDIEKLNISETNKTKILSKESKFFKVPKNTDELSILKNNNNNIKKNFNPLIFENITISINCKSRIVVVGANGQGKSTFLKMLTNNLENCDGYITKNSKLVVGYFAQHHVDNLNVNEKVLDLMLKTNTLEETKRALSNFGLNVDNQRIGTLSGGQKSRLTMALINGLKPNLLVLDEPTNHLDMESIEALADCINKFEGGVVCVSHDLNFVSRAFKEVYVCKDKTLKYFGGTAAEYKQQILNQT